MQPFNESIVAGFCPAER